MANEEGIFVYDFGIVDPSKSYTKHIVLKKEIIGAELSKWTNPLDIQFTIVKFFEKTITVKYSPEWQNQYSCNYFNIFHLNGDQSMLKVLGRSFDMEVISKKKKIILICPAGKTKYDRIDLENKSDGMLCVFLFTNMANQGVVQVNPTCGKIPCGKKVSVTVTFSPIKEGTHYERLICLIHFHKPIIYNIYTACHPNPKFELFKQINFIEPTSTWNTGFEDVFVSPENIELKSELLFCLSDISLEFDPAHPFDEENTTCQTFTAFNRTPVPLKVTWDEDPAGIFSINPDKSIIQPGKERKYQAVFRPSTPGLIYFDIVKAHLKWGSNFALTAPISAGVRLLGHSFAKDSCGWPAEYSLKTAIIIMPPTIPARNVFTTCIIKKLSSLPLMFRFIPPSKSYFSVHPRIGVINSDWQIIVFKLQPVRGAFMAYREEWKLLLNLSTEVKLELLGTAELPLITLSTESTVHFPPAYVKSDILSGAYIKNLTRHNLRYDFEFKAREDSLSKDGNKFSLFPNEQAVLPLLFSPRKVGNFQSTVYIKTYFTDMESQSMQTLVKVIGSGELPKFECIPLKSDFDNIICHDVTKRPIIIQNLGDAKAKLKLSCIPSDLFTHAEVHLNPKSIVLNPREQKKVLVSVKPLELGLQTLILGAEFEDILKDKISSTHRHETISLSTIVYNGMFPTFRLMDIQLHPIGPFVSKYCAWKILRIDRWNDLLASVNLKGKVISIKLPEGEYLQKPIKITFLVRNMGPLIGNLKLIKEECTCWSKLRIKPWKKNLCRHDQISISSPEQMVKVGEYVTAQMDISYTDELQTSCNYMIKWWAEGLINESESFNVEFITSCVKYPSGGGDICFEMSDQPLFLNSVPLSQVLSSPIQVIWLYNNTRISTRYKVYFIGRDSSYFDCFNSEGVLEGKSLHPLLMQFTPLRYREYKIILLLEVDRFVKTIDLVGRGVLFDEYIDSLIMPPNNLFSSPFPATLSVCYNYLTITNYTKTEKIVYLKSYVDESLFYEWSSFEIEGLIKATVFPGRGILKAKDNLPCLVTIQTYSQPFRLLVTLSVKLMFAEETLSWLQNQLNFNKIARTFDSCFQIKNGEYVNPQGIKMGKEPDSFYDVLTFNIHCKEYLVAKNAKQRPPFSYPKRESEESPKISSQDANIVASFFHRNIGAIMKSADFKTAVTDISPAILYPDAVHAYELSCQERCTYEGKEKLEKKSFDYQLSGRCLAAIFEKILFENVSKDFIISMPRKSISSISLNQ